MHMLLGQDPVLRCLATASLRQFVITGLARAVHLPDQTGNLRPSPVSLQLADMQEDINRLANSVALRFTDQTCVFLHTDELVAEAHASLVNVLEKGWLFRAKTRAEFFRVLKTSMCNRMRSLVQTYRFTQKRTGIKPPPKEERHLHFESCKPAEISLDDPDAHLQVGDNTEGMHEDDYDTKELVKEIKLRCNWAVRAVFEQLIEPPLEAFVLAVLDSQRGSPKNVRVLVSHKHIIAAAENVITQEGWQIAVLRIQEITQKLRDMHPEDIRYDAALMALAHLFNVQVPKSVEPVVVRRLFTIAARDNWQKVTPEVEKHLAEVGAVAPKFNRDAMNCFGVLYQRGHKICEGCGVNIACSTQAANIGLGEVTLSPKLLGAKLRRTPFILPNADAHTPPPTTNLRDMQVVDHLWRNYKRVTHGGETYLQLREFSDKQKMLFCIGDSTIPLRLRFCNPGPVLRKQLNFVNKCYYLPDDTAHEDALTFINEHAKYAYAGN